MKFFNILLTFFNVSLRIFRRYDVVFLDRRGMIGWEWEDPTEGLEKNRIYTISYTKFGRKWSVGLYGIHGKFHPCHFIPVNKDNIQGINIFKKGDYVEAITNECIGWEHRSKSNNLIIGKKYIVKEYFIEDNMVYMTVKNDYTYYHPNHFKKI